MTSLSIAHLILVSLWGGVVLAETVLELGFQRNTQNLPLLARIHFWIDCLIELPILVGVLVTGIWLASQRFPWGHLLQIKMGAGLIAVFINLYCVTQVIQRYKHRDNPRILQQTTKHISLAGFGVPFALLAAYLGVRYFIH